MKRLIFSMIFIPLVSYICAGEYYYRVPGEMEALKFSQTDLTGSARFMGMAGAFNALGGDASAIRNNPAGLGVYRSSELSITPNVYVNISEMKTSLSSKSEHKWNFNVPNFAFVMSFLSEKETGLVASNFSITYDKLKNFGARNSYAIQNSSTSILDYINEPYSNQVLYDLTTATQAIKDGAPYFTGALDNNFVIKESGGVGEWNFTYGANISNFAYLGFGLGIRTLDYSMTSNYYERYYKDNGQEDGDYGLNNGFETSGSGFNLKLGAIIRPTDYFRFGIAVQTPTFYSVEDSYSASAFSGWYDEAGNFNDEQVSGRDYEGYASYDLRTPFKLNAGLAFVIDKKAIISADYELENYSAFDYNYNNVATFAKTNQYIKEDFKAVHSFRLGAEYRFADYYSLRAGYALSTSPVKRNNIWVETGGTIPHYFIPQNNSYYTLGFGYRKNYFFVDVAYVLNIKSDYFYPYVTSAKTENNSIISNLACTFGWKF